jgi:hypothetical protein
MNAAATETVTPEQLAILTAFAAFGDRTLIRTSAGGARTRGDAWAARTFAAADMAALEAAGLVVKTGVGLGPNDRGWARTALGAACLTLAEALA